MTEELAEDTAMLLVFVSAIFFVGAGLILLIDFKSGGVTGAAITETGSITKSLADSSFVEWMTLIISFAVFVMAIRYMKGD